MGDLHGFLKGSTDTMSAAAGRVCIDTMEDNKAGSIAQILREGLALFKADELDAAHDLLHDLLLRDLRTDQELLQQGL